MAEPLSIAIWVDDRSKAYRTPPVPRLPRTVLNVLEREVGLTQNSTVPEDRSYRLLAGMLTWPVTPLRIIPLSPNCTGEDSQELAEPSPSMNPLSPALGELVARLSTVAPLPSLKFMYKLRVGSERSVVPSMPALSCAGVRTSDHVLSSSILPIMGWVPSVCVPI